MLSIKFKRIGKKHQASFRVIVDEKRHKVSGRNVEDVGWYDPRSKKHEIHKERILHWLGVGAQPTDTVWNFFVGAGIVSGTKRPVHKTAKREAPALVHASAGTQSAESETQAIPAPAAAAAPEEKKEPDSQS